MDKITEIVKSFLDKYNLKSIPVIIAFSGGWDSMCLLDVMNKIKNDYELQIYALHINHNWRGDESHKEEINCRNFCTQNDIIFLSETFSDKIAKTETAAREERYNIFEKYARKYNSPCVMTAHNKNDRAETVLYRIIKGTGIAGLQGISEKRGIFYRPLLSISRYEIENYCKSNGLSPNCDSSNDNEKYQRNFLRHSVIKLLKIINPSVENSINSLADTAQNDNALIEEYLEQIKNEIIEDNKINAEKFRTLSYPVKSRLIREIFINNSFDYDREKISSALAFIEENINSKSGKTFSLSDNRWIFANAKYIDIIGADKKESFEIKITKEGIYETPFHVFTIKEAGKKPNIYPADEENRAFADLSGFETDFVLRTRQDGDIIYPLGAKGKMKLKKYLNLKQIPKHERSSMLFLCKDNEILWAPSLGISEKIKVVNQPTHVLKLVKREGDYED